jgi:hypothetical protein
MIWRADPSGAVTPFSTLPDLPGGLNPAALKFSPDGPFGSDLYVGTGTNIFRVAPDGSATLFASGFLAIGFDGLEFSPEGNALFVADAEAGVVYRIAAVNNPPVADAGPDREVSCESPFATAVRLDGSQSSDPDGDTLDYAWFGSFAEGGGTTSGASPDVTLGLGTTAIGLVVNDGSLSSAADQGEVTVTVSVSGLGSPLAALSREPLPVELPEHAFRQGRTLPLKLGLHCGATYIGGDSRVSAPRIVELTRSGDTLDLSVLDLGTGIASDSGGTFHDAGDHWIYNLSTKSLAPGTYTMTIQTPDGLRYRTGFVLR